MEFSKYSNKMNENENKFISSFTSRVNDVLGELDYEDYGVEDECDDPGPYLSEYSLKNYLRRFRLSKSHLANSKLFQGETTVNLALDENTDLSLRGMMEIMLAERSHDRVNYLIKWLLSRDYQQCILNLPINLTMKDLLESQSGGYVASWHDLFDALEALEAETRPSNGEYRDLPQDLFGNIEDYKVINIRHIANRLFDGLRGVNTMLWETIWREHSMEELSSHFDEHKWRIMSLDIGMPCKNTYINSFVFHSEDYIVNLSAESLELTQGREVLPSQEVSQEELCEILSLSILHVLTNLIVQKSVISFILPDVETYITNEEEVYKRVEQFNTNLNEDLDAIYSLVSNNEIDTIDFVLKIFREMIDYYKSTLVELYVTHPQNSSLANKLFARSWGSTISSNTAMKFVLNPFGEVSHYHHNQSEDEIDYRIVKQFNQQPKFSKQLKFIIRKCKEQWKKMTPRSFAYQKGFNTFSFYRIIEEHPELKQPLDEVIFANKDMYGYLDTPLTNYLADKIYGDSVEVFRNQFTETFWNDLYARIAPKLDYKTEVGSEPITISLEQKDILTASFSGYTWTSCHAGSFLQSPFALAANEVTFVAYGSGGRDANHLSGTVDKKRHRAYCHYAEVGDDFLLCVEGVYPHKGSELKKLIYKALCERVGVRFDDLVRVEFPVFGQPGYEILEKIIFSGYYDYYENNVSTYMTKNLYNKLKTNAMEFLDDTITSQELDVFYEELLLASDNNYSPSLTSLVRRLDKQDIYKGIQLVLLQNEISEWVDGNTLLPMIDCDNEYSLQRYWDIVAKILNEHRELKDHAIAYYLYAHNLSDFGSPINLSITQQSMAAHDLLDLSLDYYNDEIFAYDFYPNPWGESYRATWEIM